LFIYAVAFIFFLFWGALFGGPKTWFGVCKGLGYPFCIPLNLISFFADKKKKKKKKLGMVVLQKILGF